MWRHSAIARRFSLEHGILAGPLDIVLRDCGSCRDCEDYLLALLLLPLMVQAGQAIASTITAATTCITYLAQQIFLPDLYQSFEGALSHQTFGARNYGIAPFGVTANLLHRFHENGFIIPGGTQVLFAGMVVLALGGIRNRIDTKDPRWLALVVIAIALINPLMFDYDITTAVIPSYFLLFSNLDRRGTWVLLTICCAGFFIWARCDWIPVPSGLCVRCWVGESGI